MAISWRYELYYKSKGTNCYKASYTNKEELTKVIQDHRKNGKNTRPIIPVESWVFDAVRDSLQKDETIERLKIAIRERKGGTNGKNSGASTV
jgi:hypothetical protein